MNNGWIKLYRQLREHPRRKDPEWVSIWIELMLRATHQPIEKEFSGRIIVLKPGQLITSRKSLAESCGVSESKTERVLKWLEFEQQIEQQGGNRSRLVTILNWSIYQNIEQPSEQVSNNHRTPNEQPPNTNKNEKNVRIESITSTAPERKQPKAWPSLQEVLFYADKIGLPPDEAKKFYDHYEGTGWTDKHGHPVHDWQSKCRTWKTNFEEKRHLNQVAGKVTAKEHREQREYKENLPLKIL